MYALSVVISRNVSFLLRTEASCASSLSSKPAAEIGSGLQSSQNVNKSRIGRVSCFSLHSLPLSILDFITVTDVCLRSVTHAGCLPTRCSLSSESSALSFSFAPEGIRPNLKPNREPECWQGRSRRKQISSRLTSCFYAQLLQSQLSLRKRKIQSIAQDVCTVYPSV